MATSFLAGQAQQINPMTEAVIRNYSEILAEDPKDYLTLYDRASQYYNIGDYDRALSDLDMALQYTPESEKAYRQAEYSLKADILSTQKKYEESIAATNAALNVDPASQPDLYRLGNLYLLVEKPEEALKAFDRLQRENSRSQEGFYGMAKANVQLGRKDEAEKLIKEIENLGKQSFITYCRIGDLYADMGNVQEATTNYAIAYSMEDGNPRPVESLKYLARKNPRSVLEIIESIIQSKPDNIPVRYLNAIIAYDAGMYPHAEKAVKELASAMDEDSAAVYRMMAMSQLAQNKLDEALQSIETAERLSPGSAGVLVDKAEILLNQNPEKAYQVATEALKHNNDESTLMLAANAAMLSGKYDQAADYLNEVVLINPANAEALLLRGYLNTEYKKDGKAGVADYTRAGNVNQDGSVANMVYAALGKSKVNKKLDADGLINQALAKAGKNKDDLYLIAVYFAQTGNLEKSKEYVDKALESGYSNVYNLVGNNSPLFNLSPIHHLLVKQ